LGLGGDGALQAVQELTAIVIIGAGEQVTGADLVALADLVGQDGLLFQQGQPCLFPFRVVVPGAFSPVFFGLGLPGEEPGVGLGQLGFILFYRLL
jgi:hypothetical protein